MVSQPAGALGGVLLTVLAAATSLSTAVLVGGVLLAVVAPLYLPAWRAHRRLQAATSDTTAVNPPTYPNSQTCLPRPRPAAHRPAGPRPVSCKPAYLHERGTTTALGDRFRAAQPCNRRRRKHRQRDGPKAAVASLVRSEGAQRADAQRSM